VLKYIVGATRPLFCSNGLNLHNTLGMEFLNVMKENPDSKEILKIFAKELSELEIGEDAILKQDMSKQIDLILKESSADVRTKKYLTDFLKMLNGTYRTPLTFSSTAKAPNEEEEDEDQLENIEEENEDEEQPQPPLQQDQSMDENIDIDVSLSSIKLKSFDVKIKKVEIPVDSDAETTQTSTLVQTPVLSKKGKSRAIVDESLNESEIPASPSHVDLPATQNIHVELPATQQMSEIDLTTIESSQEDVSIISSDDSSMPSTPLTVVKKVGGLKRMPLHKNSMSAVSESAEHVELPPTPEAKLRRSVLGNAKRHLDISSPITPSRSSPLRKKVAETPESAPTTPVASKSTPTLLSRMASTPNTEGRKTRRQAQVEVAQTITLTRSASKTLNVKPTTTKAKGAKAKESEKSSAKEAAKPAPKNSRLPVRRQASAPVNSSANTSADTSAGSQTRSTRGRQNSTRPPWK
jgi:hypothetical protein